MDREARAIKLTKEAKELNLAIERKTLARGKVYDEVLREKLWNVEYKSFEAWLEAVGEVKKSQAYAVAETYRDLSETIPEENLARIPMNNARDLQKVPRAKITKEVVAMAEELTNPKFRDYVDAHVQSGLHLGKSSYKTFGVSEDMKESINEVIAIIREEEGLKSDGDALHFAFEQYRAGRGGETARKFRALKALVDAVERAIDLDDVAAPPDVKAWADVLTATRLVQDVYGLTKRPGRDRRTADERAAARVQ